MTEYDISEAFRRIENELISSLIRNLDRHRAEETDRGYDWDAWQALQLRELAKYRFNNRHRFDDDFKEINDSVEELLWDSAQRGEIEAGIYTDIIRKDFRGPSFGVNSQRLDALLKATTDDLEKAEHAVLRKANDEYRKIIFDAQVYADQGGTYEKAIDMATKDFRQRGITSIVYKNGARHTIEDYASMAIKTGAKRAYLMGLGQQMARLGIHTVRVNRRTGACPYCTPWIGKVLIDDVYNEGTAEEARQKGYPLLSEAMDQGFLHPNCKDIYSMYVEGISKPEEPLTDEEKTDLQKVYDLEQELKKAEGIRDSYYRMSRDSLDYTEKKNYAILYDKWDKKAKDLEKELEELRAKANIPEPQPEPQPEPKEPPETIGPFVRGEPMDFEKADGKNCNPHYGEGSQYGTNCQSCVVAYEGRRRGFNVQARAREMDNDVQQRLAHNSAIAWIEPDTYQSPQFIRSGCRNAPQVVKYLKDNVKAGERYTFEFVRHNLSGHIVIIEMLDGEIKMYDPQTARLRGILEIEDYLRAQQCGYVHRGRDISPALTRIDNLNFNSIIFQSVLENAGS